MKKILVIGMSSNLGGVEMFIMNYFRTIDGKQIHMDFLIYEEHCVYEEEIISRGSTIYKINALRYKQAVRFWRERWHLFQQLAGEYDCIWQNDCSLASASDLRVAKMCGVRRRIFHSHNSMHMRRDKKRFFYEFIHWKNKFAIKKWATDYWACSQEAGKFCFGKKIITDKNFKVIPNAIAMSKFYYNENIRREYRHRYKIKDDCLVIGCVGRLHFQKNQSFLIDIFSEIKKMNQNTVLWLIGDGEDKAKLQEKVKELRLDLYVNFMGTRNDIPELLQAMDVFVLPSLFEGFGIVLIEAQTAGLKTFTSGQVVPANVKISELLEYIDLSNTARVWAEKIVKKIPYERKNMQYKLVGNQYNLEYSVHSLEKEFIN